MHISTDIKQVELTKEQERLWGDTRVALSWHCPAFTHIFITLLSNGKHGAVFTKEFPNAAATDGCSILINPDVFFKYELLERVFILAHEILHNILNHIVAGHKYERAGKITYPDGKSLPWNPELMNIALDLVINAILVKAQVGKFNKDWLYDVSIATDADTGVDTYRKLYKMFPPPPPPKRPPKDGQGQGPSGPGSQPPPPGTNPPKGPPSPGNAPSNEPPTQPRGPRGKSFDEHMKPGASKGKEPQTAAKERNQAEWDMHIAAAANLQRLQGKMPAGLERVFQEVLVPAVDWKDKIRALFARKLGTGSYNWKKPDRRLIVRDIYTPARSGYGAGTVVVGVDTSGSISSKEVDMFLAEVGGILEDVKPRELHLCWCDAALHRTDICDSPSDLYVIRAKGAPGGGGTSFKPVFDYVADNDLRPDCIVYLTDGHGDFPSYKPECPMIWASIDKQEYPWGDVVMIPKQARD